MKKRSQENGPIHLDGIMYNEHDIPPFLYKAMELKWATLLRNRGEIRIRKYEYYKKHEDEEIGDHFEGEHHETLRKNDESIPLTSSMIHPAFLLCSSLPVLSPESLLEIFQGYNCVIKILNVHELVSRLKSAIESNGYHFTVVCGKAIYDHGKEVKAPTYAGFSSYFQKRQKYQHQKEYRIAIIDNNFFQFEPHNYYRRKIECDCPRIQSVDKYLDCPIESDMCNQCVITEIDISDFREKRCPLPTQGTDKCKGCPLKREGYVDLILDDCSDIIEIL